MADPKVFRAVHRFARIAPRKARLVADLVRGLPVDDAMAILETHPRRAAYLLRKVLKSAMDNASQDIDVNLKALVVTDARIDQGPLLGGRARWRPRAMGRATPIRKHTSHLIIGLTEGETRRRRPAPTAPATADTQETAAPAEE